MEDFVKLIGKIGFKEFTEIIYMRTGDIFNKIYYKCGNWRIDIRILSDRFIDWDLTYSDHNPNPLDRVEVTHLSIPFDDRSVLKKYFTTEIRELRLNEIGI